MGSRKEEERNEKIIRGLMKLPPNRRCINCNSLGPQYVCTNFWTFVCMTCSGIHREFTHRVKSVSMSKFTSQEVEALQNGGNQRAKEVYLKDWDQQRQRLPDNSNVERVREFIKNVYVDRRYAEGKASDKPSRELQSLRSPEDETRRASSYHSYSQSPPYDFQYEDRRYGKQATVLTRKPGSDRGLYVGKMSSFSCSPTRSSEKIFEDRFANEGSISRVSDYSVSSGGDPVRSAKESPNFQKDIAFSRPPILPSRDVVSEDLKHPKVNLFLEANLKGDEDGIPRPQRAASLGSTESFESNSLSREHSNSGSLLDGVLEQEQTVRAYLGQMPTFPQSNASPSHGSLSLFKAPALAESSSSAAVDLFQLPATSPAPSMDLFQTSPLDTAPSVDLFQALCPAPSMSLYQSSQTSLSSSLDFSSGVTQQQSATNMDKKPLELSASKNEGWATFDMSQPPSSTDGTESLPSSTIPYNVGSSIEFDKVSSLKTSMQWPPFQNSIYQASDHWIGSLHNVQPTIGTSAQNWNAFDNSSAHVPMEPSSEPNRASFKLLATADQYLGLNVSEDPRNDESQTAASYVSFAGPSGPEIIMGPPANSSHHLVEETKLRAGHVSTNPFDLPYDSDLEPGNVFFDMSSFQAAMPNPQLPPTFLGGVNEPWFPPEPLMTYIPSAPQGSLAYISGQASSPQLANAQTQEPVAPVGGNPFA